MVWVRGMHNGIVIWEYVPCNQIVQLEWISLISGEPWQSILKCFDAFSCPLMLHRQAGLVSPISNLISDDLYFGKKAATGASHSLCKNGPKLIINFNLISRLKRCSPEGASSRLSRMERRLQTCAVSRAEHLKLDPNTHTHTGWFLSLVVSSSPYSQLGVDPIFITQNKEWWAGHLVSFRLSPSVMLYWSSKRSLLNGHP